MIVYLYNIVYGFGAQAQREAGAYDARYKTELVKIPANERDFL